MLMVLHRYRRTIYSRNIIQFEENDAVAPVGVETNMAKRIVEHDHRFLETVTSMHPIGRIADPEEIANAVVWLLSNKASFVLGHTLLIDGGMVSR